jgi:hypothetical protein
LNPSHRLLRIDRERVTLAASGDGARRILIAASNPPGGGSFLMVVVAVPDPGGR